MKHQLSKKLNSQQTSKAKTGGVQKNKKAIESKGTPNAKLDLIKKELKNKQNKSVKNSKPTKKSPNKLSVKNDEESDQDSFEEEILSDTDVQTTDESENSDSSMSDTPDIFGASLNNETDEDDDDFECDDEEDEQKTNQNQKKGVKMFGGMVSDKNEECDEDESEDDEEESEDENENENDNSKSLGLAALVGDSILDDDADGDFVANDDDDEDDDEDDDDDDEDDDEDDEESNDTINSSVEKDDGMDKNKSKNLDKESSRKQSAERTIFIGNIPKETTKESMKKLFSKYGKIENIRVRMVVPENPNMPLKQAAQTNKIHPKVQTVCMFIIFESESSAKKALEMNGKVFNGNHLRVDCSDTRPEVNPKNTVFLGNLSFNIQDEDIWKNFQHCGDIESIRIVRDRRSGLSKGFGYINFKTEDAATLALELNGTLLKDREVRVYVYSNQSNKKKNKPRSPSNQRKRSHSSDASQSPKKFKGNADKTNEGHSNGTHKQKKQSNSPGQKNMKNNSFQGQKAEANKKLMKTKKTKKPGKA